VILVADCVPVVLYDPVSHTLACVHAGWGGLVRGVIPGTVATLRTLGVDPSTLIAGVGPAIAPGRYQIGEDVALAVAEGFAASAASLLTPDPGAPGRWRFDLWRASAVQLVEAGVAADRIHVAGQDTGPGTPFFSHRSEAPTGRFALIARLHERPDPPEQEPS
jgi:YfiH family protein